MLLFVPAPRQATGQFKVRPARRAEIRAQVSGFLRVVYLEEGSRVSGDSPIACLEVPDLASNLTRKAAEVREAEARLRLLEAGSRPEEIREQSLKVERARRWHQLARQDLERRRQALAEELDRLQKQIDQAKVQFQFAAEALDRGRKLLDRQALSLDHFRDLEKDFRITKDRWDQAAAQKKEREVLGTLEQETELARREKDLADAVSALALLEVGTRPEEIQAEKARLARLIEERSFLEKMQERIRLVSPVGGVVITPRLREKIGHHFKEGELICEVEEPESLEAEIPLEEQEVSRVQPGQEVVFKARALPYTTFSGVVDRLAEQATPRQGPKHPYDHLPPRRSSRGPSFRNDRLRPNPLRDLQPGRLPVPQPLSVPAHRILVVMARRGKRKAAGGFHRGLGTRNCRWAGSLGKSTGLLPITWWATPPSPCS